MTPEEEKQLVDELGETLAEAAVTAAKTVQEAFKGVVHRTDNGVLSYAVAIGRMAVIEAALDQGMMEVYGLSPKAVGMLKEVVRATHIGNTIAGGSMPKEAAAHLYKDLDQAALERAVRDVATADTRYQGALVDLAAALERRGGKPKR